MASIFTKIIRGEIPCYKVAETSEFLAFLDVQPLAVGHTLIVPKLEIDYILDLEEDLYVELFRFARRVGIGIERNVLCKKIGMAVVGLEVPHAHVHLVPLNELSDITFTSPRLKLSKDEFEKTADGIRNVLQAQFDM
ncbi:MAG: HIT family protein [Cytophagales bacterium]|nr:MAG: HIT family protein [Cytophagales bacterium]TAF59470.1 MAG: HIT family protein [Cytophagales bacterium]